VRHGVIALAIAADVLAVLGFATLGRRSHAEGIEALGVLTTAAPFLLGLLIGWLGMRAGRAPLRLTVGLGVWSTVVVAGLGLRAALTHRLPPTFVLITAVSLALLLLGWRTLASLLAPRPSPGR
jgi:hypothetical protein